VTQKEAMMIISVVYASIKERNFLSHFLVKFKKEVDTFSARFLFAGN